jgi:hypothetical protein
MIVFCDKLMPRVLKVYCDSDWNINMDRHINESATKLKSILSNAEYQFIFLWILNENMPSFSSVMKIVGKLVLLYNDLKSSVDFNIIYCTDDDKLKLINRILSVYEPARPIKLAKTKEDVVDLINEKE